MHALSLLLLQLSSADAVGELPPPAPQEARERTRLRAALSLGGAAAFNSYAVAGGPGFSAELGAEWDDRLSLVGRVTVGTVFSISVLTGAVGADLFLSEYLSVGAGLSAGFVGGPYQDDPSSLFLALPLRLHFVPFPRADHAVPRTGLMLFLEVSPGIAPLGSHGDPRRPVPATRSPFGLGLAMGIGYAWW